MFDLHYDLLTIAYLSDIYHREDYLKEQLECLNEDNIRGVFANLYFMNEEEMKESMQLSASDINVLELFKKSKSLLLKQEVNADLVYSIEGCDYIKDEEELVLLNKEGLNSILLVWNNKNKYGSGPRSDSGLTEAGERFIKKAIDLGMGIDLSHANRATFFGIIEVIKKAQQEGKEVICYVSHSNSATLVSHPRNLEDDQLQALKEVGGMIGVVSYSLFTGKTRQDYLEHIVYMTKIFGIDNVMVSSDDMYFETIIDPNDFQKQGLYQYKTIKKDLEAELLTIFTEEETQKVLEGNGRRLYQLLKGEKNVRY